MFQTNHQYTKADIYKILRVPLKARRGAWDTGYREYKGEVFIFANIGVPGRTGHNYNNHWVRERPNSDLIWYSKTRAKLDNVLIQKMLNSDTTVHIFTRTDDRSPFTYKGCGKAKDPTNTSPIQLTWVLNKNLKRMVDRYADEENVSEALNDKERKEITRQLRSRNGQAQLKKNLLRLYKGKCCISGTSIKDILHACHIVPHATSGNNRSTNALLLRSDIHDLFDSNLIGINPLNSTVSVNKSLRYTEYFKYNGVDLARRSDDKTLDMRALKKRWEAFQSSSKGRSL